MTLNIALADKKDNRFEFPISAGETREFAKNHLLNVVSLRLLMRHTTQSAYRRNDYYYLHIMCISKRDYQTKTRKSKRLCVKLALIPLESGLTEHISFSLSSLVKPFQTTFHSAAQPLRSRATKLDQLLTVAFLKQGAVGTQGRGGHKDALDMQCSWRL